MKLTCPYCQYEMEDPDELDISRSEHEWECEYCNKRFMFTVEYDPVYYEWKAPCLNGGEHDWSVALGTKHYDRCNACGHIRPTGATHDPNV